VSVQIEIGPVDPDLGEAGEQDVAIGKEVPDGYRNIIPSLDARLDGGEGTGNKVCDLINWTLMCAQPSKPCCQRLPPQGSG